MSELVWTTADKLQIKFNELEHQHVSNIHWFFKFFWKSEIPEIEELLQNKWGGKILSYKPVWDWEAEALKNSNSHELGVSYEGELMFIHYTNEIIGYVNYTTLRSC